jgi:hypothetical protein
MRLRLLATSSLAAVLLMLAVAAPAPAASCRPVTVERPQYGGEESAYRIRTTRVACKSARRLLRAYLITGAEPIGWRLVRDRPGFKLVRGRRVIRFQIAS